MRGEVARCNGVELTLSGEDRFARVASPARAGELGGPRPLR
jgi:hypothetical protein